MREYIEKRLRDLQAAAVEAQAELFAREEAVRTARRNLSFVVGALEEARGFLEFAEERECESAAEDEQLN